MVLSRPSLAGRLTAAERCPGCRGGPRGAAAARPGYLQAPKTHVWPPVQVVPQAPQLVLLVCSLTQVPLQSVRPAPQVQIPAVQVWLSPQTVVHEPQ